MWPAVTGSRPAAYHLAAGASRAGAFAPTGKTTTEHLAARLADEACALLHHSNWSAAKIGYCLGFGHPANFAGFFKKQTGRPPTAGRRRSHTQLLDWHKKTRRG